MPRALSKRRCGLMSGNIGSGFSLGDAFCFLDVANTSATCALHHHVDNFRVGGNRPGAGPGNATVGPERFAHLCRSFGEEVATAALPFQIRSVCPTPGDLPESLFYP